MHQPACEGKPGAYYGPVSDRIYLVVGLALGVEVAATLAATHGEGGQAVLQNLQTHDIAFKHCTPLQAPYPRYPEITMYGGDRGGHIYRGEPTSSEDTWIAVDGGTTYTAFPAIIYP